MATDPPPDTVPEGGETDEPLRPRHLTAEQREDISASLEDSTAGTVAMTAVASDREAVCYQGEIASVLGDSGFTVEIDNAKGNALEEKIPPGVQATIADNTFRPTHAYRIVDAFRRAGLAIKTRISGKRKKRNTLYIAVGSNDTPVEGPATISTASMWQSKSMASMLAKWKAKFKAGL